MKFFVATCSAEIIGFDALSLTLPTQPQRYLTLTPRALRQTEAVGPPVGEPAEVLRDGCKCELVLCTARPAQSQAAKPQNALEMGEQHLDALAIVPGAFEGFGPGE